jgi:bifunctional UDP-N-acetylglucosamine pyrophosphorylase/glucosamine-1-phosphate N-acetyltransferase
LRSRKRAGEGERVTRRGDITAIVLAGGEGKRLKSDLPKALHSVGGLPLIAHVLAALRSLSPRRTIVVTSSKRTQFEDTLSSSGFADDVSYVVQDPPRGTADAVKIALESIGEVTGALLVVPGATPLLEGATLARLIDAHGSAAATLLTTTLADPSGYGRILRGANADVERIVEHRDATEQELAIDEVNSGVYVFDAERLAKVLAKVDRENTQGEYYLPDVIGLLRTEGHEVIALQTDPTEIVGVKTRAHLAHIADLLRRRTCERLMAEGVTIVDPTTTYIDASVRIEKDAVIHPFTFLEGTSSIGAGAEIGPQARIVDSEIGAGATVSYSVVRGSRLGDNASAGPFASLRPGTVLERGARVGTFVETKETRIGENSKANHLAYLGDADIGKDVNVGAGSITCNWDGTRKHKTEIEDEAYIGSDTMLVAPVHVGKRAATGAGAVVKGEVPDGALAVGVPARIIEGKGNKMGKQQVEPEESSPPTDESSPPTEARIEEVAEGGAGTAPGGAEAKIKKVAEERESQFRPRRSRGAGTAPGGADEGDEEQRQ